MSTSSRPAPSPTEAAWLVALGAIGLVDGVGSVALAYHFHHARRHDALSERLELVAHRIVVGGLGVVCVGAIVVSVVRLISGSSGDASVAGTALAAVSVVVLTVLSRRKLSIARTVGSGA